MDIIEHPLTGEKIRVAKSDFQEIMNWEEAKNACSELGSGWRLPTKYELNEIYKNKVAIGGFDNVFYWSSTAFEENGVWLQDFENGYQYSGWANSGHVRAVRTL